jgi:hypothetical protein
MPDPRTPVDELSRIANELRKWQDQIDLLNSPSGTSAYQSVSKLQGLINDIQVQLDSYMAGRYTNAQIDAMRSLAPGNLQVNGFMHANGTIGTDSLFISPAAYTTVIGATCAAFWVDNTGRIGRT